MKLLFPVVLLFAFGLNAQKPLPRKFRKTFTGTIPSYYIHGGNQLLEVGETDIEVSFSKTTIELKVGGQQYSGTYSSTRKKSIYKIDTEMENLHVNELLELNKKTKVLVRRGISPQPNAILSLER